MDTSFFVLKESQTSKARPPYSAEFRQQTVAATRMPSLRKETGVKTSPKCYLTVQMLERKTRTEDRNDMPACAFSFGHISPRWNSITTGSLR